MKKLTQWIVRRYINNYQRKNDPDVRAQYGALEGWVSIFFNIILFIFKLGLGIISHSVALIADAIHTISDSVTSIIVIIGFKISRKPSDKEHPFGHGQIEPIATLIVAVLLFILGFELFKSSFQEVKVQQEIKVSWIIIAGIFLTVLIKELLARFSLELGNMIDSDTLRADGIHHRSDALSTILVIVALIFSSMGIYWIDGVVGLLISVFICYYAFKIAKDAINPLLGEPPSEDTLTRIETIAMEFEGVYGVHDIIVHKYGQTKIISLHIEVSDKEDVNKLHDLSEKVEEAIANKLEGVVVVHIDPVNRDHPKYEEIKNFVDQIIMGDKRIKNYHELRIIGLSLEKCTVVFDIALNEDVELKKKYKIVKDLYQRFKEKYPLMKVSVKVEPRFVYSLDIHKNTNKKG